MSDLEMLKGALRQQTAVIADLERRLGLAESGRQILAGDCSTCFYGEDRGVRRGEVVCLLRSTITRLEVKLSGDRCKSWDGRGGIR